MATSQSDDETEQHEFNFVDHDGHEVVDLTAEPDTLKRALDSIINVSEVKMRFTDSGLSVAYVDPANVMMGVLEVPADAFDAYDLEQETVIGTNITRMTKTLRPARVTKNDEIRLSVKSRQMNTYVSREYAEGVESTFHNQWKLLDPDSIRQEPDIPDLGDHLSAVDVNLDQLHDAVSSVGGPYDYSEFKSVDNGLRLRANDNTSGTEVLIHGDVPDGISALYSNDYLTDIADATKGLQPDDVTLKLGEEYPLKVLWERDDGVHGEYMLAPRIQSN